MFDRCTSKGRCSTSFPSGPSWAATMDGELMRKMAVVIGQETRAGFNLKTWLDNGKNGAGLECWCAPSLLAQHLDLAHFI